MYNTLVTFGRVAHIVPMIVNIDLNDLYLEPPSTLVCYT